MEQSLLADVLSAWNVSPDECTRLGGISPNCTWKITSGAEAFVAKAVKVTMANDVVEFQDRAFDSMAARGLPVPVPLATRHGQRFARRRRRTWRLSRFVSHDTDRARSAGRRSAAQAFLRRLHTLRVPPVPACMTARDIRLWLKRPKTTHSETMMLLATIFGDAAAARWRPVAEDVLDELVPGGVRLLALPQALSHGEPLASNFLFTGDALVAVIDWDSVSVAPRVYDLGVSALSFSRVGGHGWHVDDDLVAEFIRDYGISSLSPDELRAIGPLTKLFFLPSPSLLRAIADERDRFGDWYLDWCREGIDAASTALDSLGSLRERRPDGAHHD